MVKTFQIVHKGVISAFNLLPLRLPALGDFRLSESYSEAFFDREAQFHHP